ncbi:class Ib ribonucleoside-diphosphate reductase assembly flavoprotein NrdI [Lactobacillus sp. LL6]|uniref:class Ib ribonucleoside-diphosphate reductase assembly flavoprotein NrdI n=1 Tax=Lactobacillus sp. LL6 TaxID=2596827 RepID=UPI001185E3AA|nr:class Ib ribonucleoside-diphosphate reductase assembly flavoprotein NrdI [Lactobacillus sp. LL6]TSO25713.1 class Ib ribonucleoside-diphosphate reductase assembly flavoprotein NrdI [Lactobacillus sp. LL6]
MVAVAFYSITGQTKKFVVKTGLEAHEIDDAWPQYEMGEKYVLITPSYQDFMMDSLVDFLNYKDNKKNLVGIIGCGNRNFNDLFAQTAKKLSVTLKVPILYLLEFSGTDKDVKSVKRIIKDLSKGQSTKEVQKPKELRGNISFLSDYR